MARKNTKKGKALSLYLALGFAVISVLFLVTKAVDTGVLGAKTASAACTTIQSGDLEDSSGDSLTTGYNEWGYNYQAHMFNGKYCDAYQDADWCQPYKEDNLSMKWNDAWLSNKDCDGDDLLDRHYGTPAYIGSGAWLTNHMSGVYPEEDGGQPWNYFVKISAAPEDAVLDAGIWYLDGTALGPEIWGEFAITQEVYNDPVAGEHGKAFLSEYGPGFGHIK